MTSLLNLIKIYQLVQKLLGGDTQTDRQTDWWSHKPHFPFWGKWAKNIISLYLWWTSSIRSRPTVPNKEAYYKISAIQDGEATDTPGWSRRNVRREISWEERLSCGRESEKFRIRFIGRFNIKRNKAPICLTPLLHVMQHDSVFHGIPQPLQASEKTVYSVGYIQCVMNAWTHICSQRHPY
jgi:hypothetical protein